MTTTELPTFIRHYIAIFRARGLEPEVGEEQHGGPRGRCGRISYQRDNRTVEIHICRERDKPRVTCRFLEDDQPVPVRSLQEAFARLLGADHAPVNGERPKVATASDAARSNAVQVRRATVIRT